MRRIPMLFGLALALLPCGLGAQQALTLEEAVAKAQAAEPAFAAAVAERRVAALQAKDARAALLPSASVHNQYLFTQSNHTRAQTTQGGINQALPVFIANNAVHEYTSQASVNETLGLSQVGAVRLADANAALADAAAETTRRGLVAAVVSLFYGVQFGEERAAVATRALGEAKSFVDVTEKREAAREAAHADVLKAQLVEQGRERELADATLAAQRARLELGVLMFADPSAPYALAPVGEPPMLPERADVEAAARVNNPQLRSALATVAADRAQVYSAKTALLPDLGLNFTYGVDAPQLARSGPDGARNLGYSASATVDLPLWDWLTSERHIKEAHLRADAAQVELTAAQRRLLADLAAFYAEADTARQQLGSLDASVLTARESLRLTNLRYVDGEGTVLDVVDAQNTLATAENARLDGALRYRLALAQLQTLTGRL